MSTSPSELNPRSSPDGEPTPRAKPTPWRTRWRKALLSEAGPKAMTRLLLLALSEWGDVHGLDIFPSTRTLVRATGLCRNTVEEHIRRGEAEGWIDRRPRGSGQGWRHMGYRLLIPERVPVAPGRTAGDAIPSDERGAGDAPPLDVGNPVDVAQEMNNVAHLVGKRGAGDAPYPTSTRVPTQPAQNSVQEQTEKTRPARQEILERLHDTIRNAPDSLHRQVSTSLPALYGFGTKAAQWALAGLDADDSRYVCSLNEDAVELVASVLYDMSRQNPSGFTRPRFVGFMKEAIRITCVDPDSAENLDAVELCWPTCGR